MMKESEDLRILERGKRLVTDALRLINEVFCHYNGYERIRTVIKRSSHEKRTNSAWVYLCLKNISQIKQKSEVCSPQPFLHTRCLLVSYHGIVKKIKYAFLKRSGL
ncbi:hypothetical protein AVEN_205384-1 [Araneus ventricosus]|uniref:Uncharacterized protein n=1 Tax=Araneus ventricosus TaxID=182803 RepID=A0A4Y2HVJ8_ARAVE|nr:hypothetical protein AVEN_205384-1 [Araneus ventricosus]